MNNSTNPNDIRASKNSKTDDIDFSIDDVELDLEDLEYITGGAPHFPNLTVRPS